MVDGPLICAWHECGRRFWPKHHLERFCCPACRLSRGAWKANRGGPLVDMLINNDAAGLVEAGRRIKEEIRNATARNR